METKIKDDEIQIKPKYGTFNNCMYMIKLSLTVSKSIIILCVLHAILSALPNILQLFAIPSIISDLEAHTSVGDIIGTILFFVISLMLVSAVKSYVEQNTLYGRIEVRSEIVSKIHDKLCMTSYPNLSDQKFIKMMSKARQATNSNSQATEAIWESFKDILQNIIGFVVYIILLSSLDFYIILITLVTTVVSYLINRYLGGWRYRHKEEESEYTNKIEYISENLKKRDFAKDIRVFGMKPWLEDIYNSTLNMYQSFIGRGERNYFIANIAEVLLNILRNGVAYVYLIYLVIENNMATAEFILYFTAIGGFTEWLVGILAGFNKLHKQSLDISVVREYLEYEEQFKFEDGDSLTMDMTKPYELELKNVSFKYPEADKFTLKNINLKIQNGEKLAIVGINGAGKTTLVKIMCGFLDPTEGEVLLNGKNIKKYNRRDYYKHFSAVFQEFSYLAATVAENVAQSISDIDYDKVIDCIAKADLTEKIESLQNQYDTHIGRDVYEDSVEFSGGQMQRLMLARALYKEAPFIMLDEPTAALDPIAERDIYNKYNELTNSKTSVYISHRLASTRFCDRILLIDSNVIAEEGTHDELLALNGTYRKMFDIQSQYYKEGDVCHE